MYNSEASNNNIDLNKTSSAAEEVEDEDEEDEDDNKVKSLPQKGGTSDLQNTSFITGSSFSSSASMINLLGDGTPVGASLDYDRKSYNILFFNILFTYKHYENCDS